MAQWTTLPIAGNNHTSPERVEHPDGPGCQDLSMLHAQSDTHERVCHRMGRVPSPGENRARLVGPVGAQGDRITSAHDWPHAHANAAIWGQQALQVQLQAAYSADAQAAQQLPWAAAAVPPIPNPLAGSSQEPPADDWTEAEDFIVLNHGSSLRKEHWTLLEQVLPNRTSSSIRARFQHLMARNLGGYRRRAPQALHARPQESVRREATNLMNMPSIAGQLEGGRHPPSDVHRRNATHPQAMAVGTPVRPRGDGSEDPRLPMQPGPGRQQDPWHAHRASFDTGTLQESSREKRARVRRDMALLSAQLVAASELPYPQSELQVNLVLQHICAYMRTVDFPPPSD
mmetsp:Transcript_14839/g.38627  ORF Transcript_14839/g.38627 Transcript_14839/m.38627 type:complete len:343 (+) Transcript_14839:119-1147(+)